MIGEMLFFKKPTRVVVRQRDKHPISRRNIAPEALKVLSRLSEAGYKAYLVGGSVRDLLLGRQPKDFDISTDATPNEIKRLFRNSFLVGRRFRLAHIVFGKKVVETSTFRRQPDNTNATAIDEEAPGALYQNNDNTFGTPEEDAQRRDFTINALFYNIKTFEIIDYVGGLRDLDNRLLRSIGAPDIRFREDPVRMMRAVRLAARLDLKIERKTYRAISKHRDEIKLAAHSRVLEEIFRLFEQSAAAATFKLLWQSGLMAPLLPELNSFINQAGGTKAELWCALERLDQLEKEHGQEFNKALHLATLAWPLFNAAMQLKDREKTDQAMRLSIAGECLSGFRERFKPPKAILYHTMHLLADQQRLTIAPSRGRRIRGARAEQFADAIRLACITGANNNAAATQTLSAWQKLLPAEPAHSNDAKRDTVGTRSKADGGYHRRRRPRKPRQAVGAERDE